MMKSKKDQKAGDKSIQIQAEGDVHVCTITVTEATKIAKREAQLAITEFSYEALVKATERAYSLANRVIDVFTQRPELLEAFGDPDFNFALRDASRTAASNDEKHTEDLLVDLLTNRTEQGGSPRIRLVTLAMRLLRPTSSRLRRLTASLACGLQATLCPRWQCPD